MNTGDLFGDPNYQVEYAKEVNTYRWVRASLSFESFGYTVIYKPVGDVNETVGGPTQMAIFTLL